VQGIQQKKPLESNVYSYTMTTPETTIFTSLLCFALL